MAGRRSTRSATLYQPLKLLAELQPGRDALIRACATVRPTADTYRALSAVLDAIDQLAAQLGHANRYLSDSHKTP